jgi:predicted phosphodiesterase
MRYAIVSDIHANLQAWNAVLLDARSLKTDRIICLGDVVGYGPNPAEVLASLYANVNHFLLGNHDAAVCDKIDLSLFTDRARQSIEWTRGRLGRNAYRFLARLPLSIYAENFRCAHGDFGAPGQFNYVIDPPDALPSWQAVREPLLFVGHTHQPGIYLLGASGTPHHIAPEDFMLEEGKRFLVNVGSVGQPRDRDARASYCLFDSTAGAVYWRRIPFDLDAYRQALDGAGLDDSASPFLRFDPRAAVPPLRKMLGFHPPASEAQGAHDAVRVQEFRDLQRKIRTWRYLTYLFLLALLLTLFAVSWFWYQRHYCHVVYSGLSTPEMQEPQASTIGGNLLPPFRPPGPPAAPFPGWNVEFSDKYVQSVEMPKETAGTGQIGLQSRRTGGEIRLTARPVAVQPGMAFRLSFWCRKSADFQGSIAAVVSLTRHTAKGLESLDQFVVKEPNQQKAGGWLLGQKTFEIQAGSRDITFQIRGKFSGSVELKDMVLTRTE